VRAVIDTWGGDAHLLSWERSSGIAPPTCAITSSKIERHELTRRSDAMSKEKQPDGVSGVPRTITIFQNRNSQTMAEALKELRMTDTFPDSGKRV